MTDEALIARLRMMPTYSGHPKGPHWLPNQAADRIETLIAERDHWKDVARREGVCMTCRGPNGAPETYGCTDCLNTGYCGEHHSTVADLGAKLAKPLVWRSNGKGHVCADTPFGMYEIEHGRYGMRLLHGGSFMQDDLQGIKAAKAAAQADYKARILSALDMHPTVSPDVAALMEALESAVKWVDQYRWAAPWVDQASAALARVKENGHA